AVLGTEAAAIIDVFRDIAVLLPNDAAHHRADVLRTSVHATARHWLGYLRSGPAHLRRRLLYGNEEVFARFARAVESGRQPVGISGEDALAVLRAQHELMAFASNQRPTS